MQRHAVQLHRLSCTVQAWPLCCAPCCMSAPAAWRRQTDPTSTALLRHLLLLLPAAQPVPTGATHPLNPCNPCNPAEHRRALPAANQGRAGDTLPDTRDADRQDAGKPGGRNGGSARPAARICSCARMATHRLESGDAHAPCSAGHCATCLLSLGWLPLRARCALSPAPNRRATWRMLTRPMRSLSTT